MIIIRADFVVSHGVVFALFSKLCQLQHVNAGQHPRRYPTQGKATVLRGNGAVIGHHLFTYFNEKV